ncbi:hypothetical protein [Nocardiopsis metallicus]|uniref:DUF4177 domain-containing protein n=1 Tax=Nocardiopsis metallicus TaxID=179819 RepID=A0A840WZZ6_9ACTN|nr:hypothetical protein [Nocardiopsis metallicus]MBB5495788.1 hypothetical protein [Nocardiopsis metallicus]
MQQKWEYLIEKREDGVQDGTLRTMGRQGWELVSEVVVSDPRAKNGHFIRSVFKRPLLP